MWDVIERACDALVDEEQAEFEEWLAREQERRRSEQDRR